MKQIVEFIKHRWLLLLLALVAIATGGFFAIRPSLSPLSVIGTKPADGETVTADLLREISVTLSRSLTAGETSKLLLTLSPSLRIESNSQVENIIRFRIAETPAEQTAYTVTLTLGKQTLSRWTINTALRLGGGLGDPKRYQEIYEQDIQRYPLLIKTPYETSEYTVFYSAPMILTIKVKPTTKKIQENMKPEVVQWIRANGGDPIAHTIVFK